MEADLKSSEDPLATYRADIDALDDQIIPLLAKRMEIVKAVGALKAQENIEVIQGARAEQVLNRVKFMAKQQGLEPGFAVHIYKFIIDYAHKIEAAIGQKPEE